jgi:hypothetical protein
MTKKGIFKKICVMVILVTDHFIIWLLLWLIILVHFTLEFATIVFGIGRIIWLENMELAYIVFLPLLVFDNYSTCIVYCIIEYIISRDPSVKEIPPGMALVKNIRFSWSVGWVFEVGGFDYQRWKRLYEEFFKSLPSP